MEKALIINDIHIPFSCKQAVDLTLAVAKVLTPDMIVINGDLVDCWEISTFVKNPTRRAKNNIADEIAEGRRFLRRLRAMFPDARIKYIFGNHEYRWVKFIASHAQELARLKGLTLEEQLECREMAIQIVNSGNRESSFQWGKLLIGHFDKVNQHSAYTAKNLLDQKGISLIQAHTHRGGSSFKRVYDRDIVAYENFCLCDRNPEYVDRPNWQLGFSVVYKDSKSDFFYVEPHPITEIERPGGRMEYRTYFNGDIYKN